MNKKTTISIIIVLLALALIAAVCLGCKRKQEKATVTEKPTTTTQEQSSQPATQLATLKPSAKKESYHMSDWKTYTNSKYGYSVKYPKEWYIQKEGEPPYPGPPYSIAFSKTPFNQKPGTASENYCHIGISASSYDNQSEISSLSNKDYTKSIIYVDGVEAIRFTRSNLAGIADAVYFTKNDIHFRIARNKGFGNKYESECKLIFNQMLARFKFIEGERQK